MDDENVKPISLIHLLKSTGNLSISKSIQDRNDCAFPDNDADTDNPISKLI